MSTLRRRSSLSSSNIARLEGPCCLGLRSGLACLIVVLGCGGTAGELFDADAGGNALSVDGGRGGRGSLGGVVAGRGGAVAAGGGSVGSAGSAPTGVGASVGLGAGGATPSSAAGTGGSGMGPIGSAGPSSGASGGGPGSGPRPPQCDPCPCGDGPFGAPELVAGLGLPAANNSFGPAPSADGLTLFFSSEGAQEDIFFAARTTRANQFDAVQLVSGVNDPTAADGTPFISADDRSLYFFSTRPDPDAPGDRDLWVATRAEAGEPFAAPALVPGVNTPELEHLPRLTPDGLALLFVSGRDTVNLSSNIWQTSRATPSAAFSVPSELPGVNSNSRDEGFGLSADGLTVFFASNRQLATDMDIWVATRRTVDEAFGEPENLSIVNTAGIEIDPAVTLDGFELFFASDRGGAMQLYRSARVCD